MISSNFEQHSLGVLHQRLDALQEEHCVLAVQQPVVVGQCEVHHWPCDDLIAPHHWPVYDRVHAQDGGLGRIDDGGSHERAEGAAVGDREGSALHVLQRDLSLLALLGEMREALSKPGGTSSKSWNFMSWQFLSTGTSRPVGVETATEMST